MSVPMLSPSFAANLAAALIAVPIMLPSLAGTSALLFRKRHRAVAAGISIGSCLLQIAVAVALLVRARHTGATPYAMGNWPAPFGIVLVLDRLSAWMLLLTAIVGFAVATHAALTRLDRKGWNFHPIFQFQLLGLNGAFLTGDLFNLFVFFEVLLIASYGLILHGQGARRLTSGVQYIVVNLTGSTLFLIALGLLYGVTGTLNMADMAARGAALPHGDRGLFEAAGYLLIAVFALKAALLPLHLWLPRAYASAAPPVAALFAIMTKVGAYSIIRTAPLIFGDHAQEFLLPASLATIALGFTGMLAARGLRDMTAFGLIGSTGTLLAAIALFRPEALAAALYYLPHTTIAAALLFLTVDLVVRWRGVEGDAIVPTPAFSGLALVAFLFLAGGVALAGLPPLSGFIGKLLILDAAIGAPLGGWIWGVILITSLIAVIALARAGSTVFWKRDPSPPIPADRAPPRLLEALPALFLLATLVALTAFAGPATRYAQSAAAQVFDQSAYRQAVLSNTTLIPPASRTGEAP
ncbi:monovalent cation/H+ antiporter subunit D [Novosphingobium sp. 1949]|uniref:Monovalent cation/H+ antiporter subunit D n=1 Tax=Novosphingobium organovorum TaxID=2930092 RepID=A0ABT0BCX8_9SPHN|nr:monovalent cation/H+ antiporter subunit D [Novosphingobium organovorum]MCJ2182745.1 monovalent cation/H+ antiporter subunit D [Novosphingobium organovorum]